MSSKVSIEVISNPIKPKAEWGNNDEIPEDIPEDKPTSAWAKPKDITKESTEESTDDETVEYKKLLQMMNDEMEKNKKVSFS